MRHGSDDVVVLGSGMAAWGAFDRLTAEGLTPRLFDASAHPGGHTASLVEDGFVFDDGPHISFTSDEEMQGLLAEAVDGAYETRTAVVDNYYEGHWVKHPAITYLHGLPTDLVVRCLEDFIAVHEQPTTRPETFRDWLLATYGEAFTDHFPARYGRKYHTVDPAQMTTTWLGPRLYRPSLAEVLRGAIAPPEDDKHYISEFRYPSSGGFQAYLQRFIDRARPALDHRAVRIDPEQRTVTFANGHVTGYDHLISSVPLPELVGMLPVPARVSEAAARLACTSCVLVNLGVDRDDLSPAHWRYVYDEDLLPVRLSFPHLLSPDNAPPGHGSIQVEVYSSDRYRPRERTPEEHVEPVIADLRRMGVLEPADRIVHRSARLVEYANVIFDQDSSWAPGVVRDHLAERGIDVCGRYGDWGYYWTDASFLSGRRAAQRVLDRCAAA